MTIKREILDKLRRGVTLAEIRREYRSQSQLYEAIREFLEEADKIVGETQKKLGELEADLVEAGVELERAKREREEVSGEIRELGQAKEKLGKEVAAVAARLNGLTESIEKLQAKGFTPEIVSRITAIESRSGPELLTHVETVSKYVRCQKDFSALMQKRAKLDRKARALEIKVEKSEKRLRSERNKHDELKLRTVTFEEAVAVVSSFFKDGYSTADIKSLKHGLDKLGISGDPVLSITRLVNGLAKQKGLIRLEERAARKRKELSLLRRRVADERAALKASQQTTRQEAELLQTHLEDLREAGVKAIAGVAESAKRTITDTAGVAEDRIAASAVSFDDHIQHCMEEVKAGLGEWSELQQRKGRLQELLHHASVLFGILNSPEYVRELPPTFVFQLFDKLRLWSDDNLHEVFVSPSPSVCRKDLNLNPCGSYRLAVLIEFICESMREMISQQGREA